MDRDYLGIKEIAAYLGVRESHLYVLVETKQIPCYRVGRLLRFKKQDVDSWMEVHKQGGNEAGEPSRCRAPRLRSRGNVDGLVEKIVASAKNVVYNTHHGKPDRVGGLRKEAKDGAL